ncbi:hypothetical protein [Scytonema sp. PRP1]|uniref:hypothetical protein n=1 Tax=Scytonema sp. PRP1 TaxID=3120513 RepID=UPI002FD38526
MTQLGNATRLFGGAEYGHKDRSRAAQCRPHSALRAPLVPFVLVLPNGSLDAVSYANATLQLNFLYHPAKSCILLISLTLIRGRTPDSPAVSW